MQRFMIKDLKKSLIRASSPSTLVAQDSITAR